MIDLRVLTVGHVGVDLYVPRDGEDGAEKEAQASLMSRPRTSWPPGMLTAGMCVASSRSGVTLSPSTCGKWSAHAAESTHAFHSLPVR